MINDLAMASGEANVSADICIIGSGPAGLTLARALSESGLTVVIVESGPAIPRPPTGNEIPEFTRREYKGATAGRSFGLGGTSALWGGQLLPIRPDEMRARAVHDGAAWPIDHEEIAQHFGLIESWTGVASGAFEVSREQYSSHPVANCTWHRFAPRFSKWIPFRRRNLAKSWLPALRRTNKVQIWINATARFWASTVRESNANMTCLTAVSTSGIRLNVVARTYVICAGAVESTRIVLEMARAGLNIAKNPESPIGGMLHDHVSLRIGEIVPVSHSRTIAMFAPLFVGSTMRSLRLDLTTKASIGEGLPPAYIHVVMAAPDASGFAALRGLFRSVQALDMRRAALAGFALMSSIPEVLAIVYWRFVRKRLMFTHGGKLYFNLDFEQPPLSGNRMTLMESHDSVRDRLEIDWDLPPYPAQLIDFAIDQIKSFWQSNGMEAIAHLHLLNRNEIMRAIPDNMYDVFHPAGTTRMGKTEGEGVVDPNLRVFGTANCYVLSTSVFPSMGTANPTFTLMALAVRLAHQLKMQAHATGR